MGNDRKCFARAACRKIWRTAAIERLAYSGSVDSVGMAELTFDIEKEFKIHVDDGVLEIDTVQDLVDYIREKQVEQSK